MWVWSGDLDYHCAQRSTIMAKFIRFIRFEDDNGQEHYRETGKQWKEEIKGRLVPIYDITTPWDKTFYLSGRQVSDIPINYDTRCRD
jgi:hypothetical protein